MLLLAAFDLQGCVGQAAAADRLLVGHLDHGDVVIALPEREKRHLHLVEDLDQFHAEDLGVELD
jgi:hypothetical protein